MLPWLLLLAFQGQAVFQTGVSLVHVDVAATAKGQPLAGLTAEDFQVTDNGEPAQILHFAQQEQPLDVVLLMDISASMEPVVSRISAAASLALAELRPGDRVALMSFSDRTQLRVDFTTDLTQIEKALPELLQKKFAYDTALHTAIDNAAVYFLAQPSEGRRRAILTITDNLGTDSRAHVVDHLWEGNTVLSGLILSGPGQSPNSPFAMLAGMTGIAQQSGGDAFSADNAGEGFRQMMRRLRMRYSLDYAMPAAPAGEKRTIEVQLTDAAAARYPNATIRARSGYIVPARPDP